jgi:hypothetical protein
VVSDADIQRHDRELEKVRDLALEAGQLARSAAQSFEQVVVPAVVDINDHSVRLASLERFKAEFNVKLSEVDTLSSAVEELKGDKAKQAGVILALKVGASLIGLTAVMVEILRYFGVV